MSMPWDFWSDVGSVYQVADLYSKILTTLKTRNFVQQVNYYQHSSEIRGLCSTKCSSEMLQNLLYFMYKKTNVVFLVFHFVQLYFSLMNALVYVDIAYQGIHKGKSKVAQNEKLKKLHGFSYT